MNKTEIYEIKINTDSDGMVLGDIYNDILEQQGEKFSGSTDIIVDNVSKIYKNIRLIQKKPINRNLLLVGKVQSGKTANLELLTALLFDNGYNFLVIYGGYDNKLLEQSYERFKERFSRVAKVFSSFGNDFKSLIESPDIISNHIKSGGKIILVSLKKNSRINEANKVISKLQDDDIKPFIIDDEGDQASLNTEFLKKKESATYNSILNMKRILKNPPYISTTATPYANLFLPELSELRPEGVITIMPGNNYYGLSDFHVKDDVVVLTNDTNDDTGLKELDFDEVKISIKHFLIASSLAFFKGINNADMIIHTNHLNVENDETNEKVSDYLKELRAGIEDKLYTKKLIRKEMLQLFNKKYFDESIIKEYEFDDIFEDIEKRVIRNTYPILYTGKGKDSQLLLEHKDYKIFIGGNLIQRGLTFPNLLTVYFTRWPKTSGNMDTVIQRARWLGYRKNIYPLMRLFITEDIRDHFYNLTAIEDDLWSQLVDIEEGELNQDDLIIDVSETNLSPSRRNVIEYEKTKYNRKWHNQVDIISIADIVSKNNNIINDFFKKYNFNNITIGSVVKNTTGVKTSVGSKELKDMLNSISVVNNFPPLKELIISLDELNNNHVDVVFIGSENSYLNIKSRERTVTSENKILALHQGRDASSSSYLGDSSIIVDRDKITIQIHNIIPKINGEINSKLTQYMFSVYYPFERDVIRRKK